jgi:hypothetical protein
VTGWCGTALTNVGTMLNSYVNSIDGFVIKYDNNGAFVWGQYIGGTTTVEQGMSIAVDSTGVYVTGFCSAVLSNVGTMSNSIIGAQDVFIIKYNINTGAFVWGRYIGGTTGGEQVLGVTADSTGVYVTGFCTSALTNVGGTMSNSFISSQDGFIIKYT